MILDLNEYALTWDYDGLILRHLICDAVGPEYGYIGVSDKSISTVKELMTVIEDHERVFHALS